MSPDAALLIGRWQLVRRSQGPLWRAALSAAPKVVVVIGSAWRSRDSRNPFTWQERQQQLEAVLSPSERERVTFVPVRDYYDDDLWRAAVRASVNEVVPAASRVTLVSFRKPQTAPGDADFPEWPRQEILSVASHDDSDLLSLLFESGNDAAAFRRLEPHVDAGVLAFLERWIQTPAFRQCATEHEAVVRYRKKYTAPFSLTADALVTTSGHVLLIRRGGTIGHGLWALPGGFLDPDEQFHAAAVRELAEETGLRLPPSVLKAALRSEAVFDRPRRSARGRIVTCAFHFDLGDRPLPGVRGADDAKEARWVALSELSSLEEALFEDHGCILDRFLDFFPKPGTVRARPARS